MRAGRPGSALKGRLLAARIALIWEAFWPAFWPVLALAGLFLVLSLGGLWGLMPAGLHAAGLVLIGIGLVAAFRFALSGLALPDVRAGYRRLERVNGLAHRPLSARDDVLAGSGWDAASRAIWEAHQARQRAIPTPLKVGWPRAGLMRRDPYALRVALLAALVVAFAASSGSRGERLAAAFHIPGTPPPAAVVDAWITPPAFAGAAPIFLSAATRQANKPLAVPSASQLTVRVHGASGRPRLMVDGKVRAFKPVDRANWALKTTVGQGRDFIVADESGPLVRWHLAPIPELPPKIAFDGPPHAMPTGALRITYQASDAYGLSKVTVEFRRVGSQRVVMRDLHLSALDGKEVKGIGFTDLTADPWAGLAVEARLIAIDLAGKQGRSLPLSFVLPERQFHNPVARAVALLRRTFARDPSRRLEVAAGLGAIAEKPESYQDDPVVLLALTVAAAELADRHAVGDRTDVLALLWNTALRIEDGAVSQAREALRRAEQRLMEAMQNKAPTQEIQRRLDTVQRELDRFLAALAKRAAEMGNLNRSGVLPPNAEAVTPQALRALMQRIRSLTDTGAQAAAQQMLAKLQNLIERLQLGNAVPPRVPPEIAQLSRLMARQRHLLDRSFRAFNGEPSPGAGRGAPLRQSLQDLAQEQKAIREALAAIEKKLKQGQPAAEALRGAGRSMAGASTALGMGGRDQALANEGEALTRLGQGLQALWREMMAKQGAGKGMPGDAMGFPAATDPLGRPLPSFWDTGAQVKIPDHDQLQRSRVILQELYRRLDDPSLPPVERQYIERLLRFF